MHETSDDVRLEVGPDGVATVEHHLRYRIVAGRFKTFELAGVDPRAEVYPEAVLTDDKSGDETLARVEPAPRAPGTLRIMIDEGKGLGRGTYVVDVAYKLDLVATRMLTRDGAMWKLAWTAPPAPEGHDGARVVFGLPAAKAEPRLAADGATTTTLSTLRRSSGRDELELVRAHVPRGEAVTWAARVDPKAFSDVTSPTLLPPPAREGRPPSRFGSGAWRALVALGLAVLAGALASLLRAKQAAVRAAAALRSSRARPLLPVPWAAAPFVYGVVTTLALAALLWWSPAVGALLVVLAMALAAHRAPAPIVRPRGPGVWRPIADPKALLAGPMAPLPTDPFDVTTTRGRLTCVALTAAVIGAAWLLWPRAGELALALPLTSAALAPIFVTGTRRELPRTPTELAARALRPARDALAVTLDLAHVDLGAIGRVVGADGAVDEIRLACAPRDRTPGLRVIELALATYPGGYGGAPEVFVRFDDGSAAAERVARLAPGAPVVVGRTPEERVVRLSPEEPTPASSAALVATLALALEGRRATDRADPSALDRWEGTERRGQGARSSFQPALMV